MAVAGRRAVVLVEGASDAAALHALAARLGRSLPAEGVDVVAMGGATNVRRYAAAAGDVLTVGLCDVGERRFFERVLDGPCHVCDRDLEDELVRALGVPAVLEVVEAAGELRSLRSLQQQAPHRERPEVDQLRRFLSSHSGRKERYARLLVDALPLDRVPAPLAGVLSDVRA
ncbi:TOPRIM nucleotidyl transferase/hydrolase domain-containing protein [Angustibacter aerolatus]